MFGDVDDLRWRGAHADFRATAERIGDLRLVERCEKAVAKLGS